jgi:hypothetical protein
MNPILLYPQNAAQAKFFQENAEEKGVQMVNIPINIMEVIDDMLFANSIEEGMNTPEVSEDEIFKILGQCK